MMYLLLGSETTINTLSSRKPERRQKKAPFPQMPSSPFYTLLAPTPQPIEKTRLGDLSNQTRNRNPENILPSQNDTLRKINHSPFTHSSLNI
jgi:hypothetical protein